VTTDDQRSDGPTNVVPVLDIGPYLGGEAGAAERTAAELRAALEEIGFFFIVGHGVPWSMVEAVYQQARRLHALDDAAKEAILMTNERGGYLHLGGGTSYASAIAGQTASFSIKFASTEN